MQACQTVKRKIRVDRYHNVLLIFDRKASFAEDLLNEDVGCYIGLRKMEHSKSEI